MSGFVYFLLDAEGQAVKIGFANQPRKRASNCLVGNPNRCELYAIVPGTMQDELALHNVLSERRRNGEWFKWDLITHELIERAKAGAAINELISFASGELFTRFKPLQRELGGQISHIEGMLA